jgi:hypothetical protein
VIEVLLFGGPLDGTTLEIPSHTEFINVPYMMLIARDEIGRFIDGPESLAGHYVYDSERSIHNIIAEKGSGPSEPCYRWDKNGY